MYFWNKLLTYLLTYLLAHHLHDCCHFDYLQHTFSIYISLVLKFNQNIFIHGDFTD